MREIFLIFLEVLDNNRNVDIQVFFETITEQQFRKEYFYFVFRIYIRIPNKKFIRILLEYGLFDLCQFWNEYTSAHNLISARI